MLPAPVSSLGSPLSPAWPRCCCADPCRTKRASGEARDPHPSGTCCSRWCPGRRALPYPPGCPMPCRRGGHSPGRRTVRALGIVCGQVAWIAIDIMAGVAVPPVHCNGRRTIRRSSLGDAPAVARGRGRTPRCRWPPASRSRAVWRRTPIGARARRRTVLPLPSGLRLSLGAIVSALLWLWAMRVAGPRAASDGRMARRCSDSPVRAVASFFTANACAAAGCVSARGRMARRQLTMRGPWAAAVPGQRPGVLPWLRRDDTCRSRSCWPRVSRGGCAALAWRWWPQAPRSPLGGSRARGPDPAGLARPHVGTRDGSAWSAGGGARRPAGWDAALRAGDRACRARPVAFWRDGGGARARGGRGSTGTRPCSSYSSAAGSPARRPSSIPGRAARCRRCRCSCPRSRVGSAVTRLIDLAHGAGTPAGAVGHRLSADRWAGARGGAALRGPGPARPGCSIGSRRRATWCASRRWRRAGGGRARLRRVDADLGSRRRGLWLDASAACARIPCRRGRHR